MVQMVRFGRVWEINSREDYEKALDVLDSNKFCAMMSDDFHREMEERAEIERQRKQVIACAREIGLEVLG